MKIVFGIMSAVHSAESVNQLANALAPWPVVVHHDFGQQPDFKVTAPNAHFVSDPKKTGWAVWGFSEGILHLLNTCLNEHDADYFQLLSPTCLPIKPVEQFADYIQSDRHDVHIGAADILLSDDLEMNFGYRAYAAKNSLRFRFLQQLRSIYFADSRERVDIANMQTCTQNAASLKLVQKLAREITHMARRGWLGSHPFVDGQLRTMIGGTWFGCRRQAGEYLLARVENPVIRRRFAAIAIPDEMMFSSIFSSSPFDVGPPNHLVNTFDEHNPKWIEADQLDQISASPYFFARKFHDDPADPVRQLVLTSIGQQSAGANVRSMPSQSESRTGIAVN